MKIYLFIVNILLLSGCSVFSGEDIKSTDDVDDSITKLSTDLVENNGYFKDPLITDVNDYAKWLMQDLISNIDLPSNDDVFIVSDIALLDSDLNKTNHFGRQLTEALIHEVNRAGFSVIDVKNRGFIRFSENGDVFYQTRDHTEVSSNIDATSVITGTMTRHRGGYLVNAKIIDIETNALISSGQILVPHDVVDSIYKEELSIQHQVKTQSQPEVAVQKNTSLKLKAYKKNN